LRIALELARDNHAYEDIATKFFEHFLAIAAAMTNMGGSGVGLWDETDEFYYDALTLPDGSIHPLKVRSIVGLIPLFAVEILEPEVMRQFPEFARRLDWFLAYRPDFARLVSHWTVEGAGNRRLLSLLRGHRMKRLLRRMLDPDEFLSPYGVRSLSRSYASNSYQFRAGETCCKEISYEPAEELTHRLRSIFRRDEEGKRPVLGNGEVIHDDPGAADLLLFYEYYDGDTGRGCGASHQTGWSGLIAHLLKPLSKAKSFSS
jgi:hypothetical protein